MKPSAVVSLFLIAVTLVLTGCANRAGVRIPKASGGFPEKPSLYVAKAKLPYRLVVERPVDIRPKHYGEYIDNSRWMACSTDGLWGPGAAGDVIQERLVKDFTASGMFTEVTTGPAQPGDVVLKTGIRAFGSRVQGAFVVRVAGIDALDISLSRDGTVLLAKSFEKVVTDAESEYTGSQVTFIEQVMRVTMADALRELLKQMLPACEAAVK